MLLIARCLFLLVMLAISFVFALVYCTIRPRHKNSVHLYATTMARFAPILGIKVILRNRPALLNSPCIFTANHQNNFDAFTLTKAVPKSTVSLGKKSIVWMPLFGQIYWLTGNILIDRGNRQKALDTLKKTVQEMRQRMLSLWVFPEGTRSRGRGMLPFKLGAFYTAVQAKVPIVPVVASCQKHINLNRWRNGVVIVEMLEPISTLNLSAEDVKQLAEQVRKKMLVAYDRITQEAQNITMHPLKI
jgi:1-acyl-sn-glycerol-3-phosphate acyltransferase